MVKPSQNRFLFFVHASTGGGDGTAGCTEEQFACGDVDATCIPIGEKCNGNDNCPMGTDEQNCEGIILMKRI